MKIEFKEPETFRDVRIETQAFDSFFRQEHEERRPTRDVPQGFSPSVAFDDRSQQLQTIRKQHTAYLNDKLDQGKQITPDDLKASYTLEALSILSSSDPKGQGMESSGRNPYQSKMRDLERGKGTETGRSVWKNIEKRANAVGLMAGGSPMERMTVSMQYQR